MIAVNLIFERENGTALLLRPCKRRGCGTWAVVSRWSKKKIFCTAECKVKFHNTDGLMIKKYGSPDPKPVPCLLCGGLIDIRKPGHKLYDSRKCLQKHKRLLKSGFEPVDNCEVCDKELLPLTQRRVDQTVCSKACDLERDRQQHALKKLHADEKSGKIKQKVEDTSFDEGET